MLQREREAKRRLASILGCPLRHDLLDLTGEGRHDPAFLFWLFESAGGGEGSLMCGARGFTKDMGKGSVLRIEDDRVAHLVTPTRSITRPQ